LAQPFSCPGVAGKKWEKALSAVSVVTVYPLHFGRAQQADVDESKAHRDLPSSKQQGKKNRGKTE